MDFSTLATIQHDNHIFSLALSQDDKLLACGGSNGPVTVWLLDEGREICRLNGLAHHVHSLAFSGDGRWLAAVNIWGGLCVWQLSDGTLVEQRPAAKARRMRSLVYPSTSKRSNLPVQISESIHSQAVRRLAADGKVMAVQHGAFLVRVEGYKTKEKLGGIDLDRYRIAKRGARQIAWSSDSRSLALSGDGWAGLWMPFEESPTFYAVALESNVTIEPIVVLSKSKQLLFARGSAIAGLEFKPEPILTDWQDFLSRVPEPADRMDFKAKRDWTWSATSWGYEGVHTHEGKVVWYIHSHNPHGGGGAHEQSFQSFLEEGPGTNRSPHPIPEEVLRELSQAVRFLSAST